MIEELEDLGVTYAVFQLEEGENGTPHYQGYVAFEKKKRLTAIEHLLRGAGHWEISRGSPTQNREYCTKDDGRIGDFSEIGTLPAGQGARSDLVGLHSALKDGLTQADYANEYFSKFISTPTLSRTTSFLPSKPGIHPNPSHLGFSSAPQCRKISPRSRAWQKESGMDFSSDTLSESGSTDTEENELSYSTIFADLHSLSRNLNAFLTDTPFEWNSRGLLVKWQPQTSSSPQTKTPKRGGKKA